MTDSSCNVLSCSDPGTECHGGVIYLCSIHYAHAAELVNAPDAPLGLTVEGWLDQVNENAAEMGATATPTETITFEWSRNHGDCYDCGLPAAYEVVGYLVDKALARMCSVCAACHAADGFDINRLNADD